MTTNIPPQYCDYPCEEYFAKYASTGYFDEPAQYWFIDKAADIEELIDDDTEEPLDFLSIGGPGMDGIRWGYRKGMPGIWAWFPISGDFERTADSIDALIAQETARREDDEQEEEDEIST